MGVALKLLAAVIAGILAITAGGILANRPPLLREPGAGERLQTYLRHNVAETRPEHRFPELRTPRYPHAPEAVFAAARQAAASLGWQIQRLDAAGRGFDAVATTPLWRFKDDIRVEVQALPNGSALYIRSASRVGRGDLGANLRRVIDFQAELASRL